jgi:hypothetical protein
LNIEYKLNKNITSTEFIDVLKNSTLGERKAIDEQYQKSGICKKLISEVQKQLNNKCKIILLSVSNATKYYPKINFTLHNSAWILLGDSRKI